MKKVLVHNFTRMGDLLQSTPLLEGIKKAGYEVVLAVHKSFSEICKGFPFVDKIMPFDSDTLKEKMMKDDNFVDCFLYVKNYIQMLKRERFDMVINLSHSRQSAVLLSILDVRDTRGVIMDGEGNLFTLNPWANYFKNMSLNRLFSPFNLVDIYKRMGNIKDGPRRLYYEVLQEERDFAGRMLRKYGVEEGDLLVGIQPGASEDTRRWPPEAFADLIKRLKEDLHAKIIIFGTSSEIPLGREIEERCQLPVVNVMGTTTLSQLAALLENCRLLITNDTGTMHLAVAVGTKVVALFMGPALYYQTGPYGEDHLIIQTLAPCAPCVYSMRCPNPLCKQYITPSMVFQVAKLALQENSLNGDDYVSIDNAKVEVLKSGFDGDGFLTFRPLQKTSINLRKFLMLTFKEAWKVILDGKPMEEAISDLSDEMRFYHSSLSIPELREELFSVLEGGNRLIELSMEGIDLTAQLLAEAVKDSLDIDRIRRLTQRIEDLDERIKIFGSTREEFREFTYMFKFGKENLQGNQLLSLTEQTMALYKELKRQIEITSCLIRKVMGVRDE